MTESIQKEGVAPTPPQADDGWLRVESLDLEAQGVTHRADGKVIFIEGALPFEEVRYKRLRAKNNWEQGELTELRSESSQRVRPGCQHFGLHSGACGGCKMQHLDATAQVAVKQRALEDQLWHLGKVKAESLLRPLQGPAWHYRYRARLSVRHVVKKGAVLIGFHERKSRYIADMKTCPVLPSRVSDMLLPLRGLIASMDARDTCPQIELACGDAPGSTELGVIALVLRHLEPLSAADIDRLTAFAAEHAGVQWWLQPKGPDTAHLLDAQSAALAYELPDFGVRMPFKPTDFTQVNPSINRVLVSRALRLLDVRTGERVIDWFCGLGNFTLPLATRAAAVLGIEGSDTLVARATENCEANRRVAKESGRYFSDDVAFVTRNLFEMTPEQLVQDGAADRWLVDPPREGAFALAKALAELHQQQLAATPAPHGWTPPRRIVYVSCNPATLARDAGLLVHQAGYRCTHAGVVNMFPHTAHVESMAVFDLA
ncbi:23S rRNA (uracil(1939)-C(5))-methyltransferase RlmD [Variovorax dokdonensis]|uniref:23S rRNA (uracil(1939)-C(5))-methyltransferase RlmD n=1 Tax=Variovorax dokdonensis TaxID=344883 RepID=A0ABT7NEU0_9BURK|nr:23S rRNA (uracil(1939)-C(5))-methyltransferase RlmD [Variovorax dokdonensis]MDM0046340.1 23S rRNA (uracil(1939)-C(5))-methyltransferase RlmD [Variovorax dokdonensis]